MDTLKSKKTDIGVIVARFQVNELHTAHLALINTVKENHDRVIIFLGISPLKNSANNPIPFIHRARMITDEYPDIEVYPQHDMRSDELWSNQLDRNIAEWVAPGQTVTLYGSRDSFIKHYNGKHATEELISDNPISGSDVRKKIITNHPSTDDFRAGLIAATGWRYPTAYQTVDVAIVSEDSNKMLLARKAGETLLRFVGGFSDPSSDSLEEDARREVMEETGVEVDEITYVGSCKINDWRYRGEKDVIKTAFFMAKYTFGAAKANDDIVHADWYNVVDILDYDDIFDKIVPEHRPLAKMLKSKLIA
jgi:bifunctional NMN adenylyltransferase/nudix hydrolase